MSKPSGARADRSATPRSGARVPPPRVQPLSTGGEWSFELIDTYDRAIREIAVGEFGLDCYPNQIEIIASEQMLDAYASLGLPIGYAHWSFGKEFIRNEHLYRKGHQGLAYEIVINSNPCIAYLMEENTMPMQALVIAHACYGHNSFFKGNYLFRQWTDADAIIDYMVFAKKYVMQCEERYGEQAVEEVLDSCHALMQKCVRNAWRDAPRRAPPWAACARCRRTAATRAARARSGACARPPPTAAPDGGSGRRRAASTHGRNRGPPRPPARRSGPRTASRTSSRTPCSR